ncbi:MAG: UDP-glucose 4-epimerase GalE [Anaerolineae bacterium]|nr:UDP-glucose 4-epimerase GalE [Anaerolineae bacterium]
MNIFVTGGAGYIGSATAQALIDAGHRVTVYDSLVTGHRAAVPREAEFTLGDLADGAALAEALGSGKFEAVMHFAAFIEAGESMQNPGKYFHNNLANSLGLIEAVHQAGVKHFVLSSTAAIYRASDDPLTEEAVIEPQNTYGQTKLMIEQTLEWYRRVHGMHLAALRYFNAAGATEARGEAHQPESHLIPLVLRVALGQREMVSIFGTDYPTRDGTAVRDYIHIEDLASAHVMTLGALTKTDKLVYNLGNGKGYSVREVIEAARKVTGHAIPAEDTPRRPGDPARLVASSERIRKELGWQPKTPNLEDIIASAWEWHHAHPDGYVES